LTAALAAGASLALRPRRAWAIGPGSRFRFGQLVLGKDQPPRPNALRRMVGLAKPLDRGRPQRRW
jgi:hypothetical protein